MSQKRSDIYGRLVNHSVDYLISWSVSEGGREGGRKGGHNKERIYYDEDPSI